MNWSWILVYPITAGITQILSYFSKASESTFYETFKILFLLLRGKDSVYVCPFLVSIFCKYLLARVGAGRPVDIWAQSLPKYGISSECLTHWICYSKNYTHSVRWSGTRPTIFPGEMQGTFPGHWDEQDRLRGRTVPWDSWELIVPLHMTQMAINFKLSFKVLRLVVPGITPKSKFMEAVESSD